MVPLATFPVGGLPILEMKTLFQCLEMPFFVLEIQHICIF